ncbi:MAG: hypothetical protein C0595_05280 [Marinilabiliales bacterium]|nr:MAG: hypothetical protein C0595_05280 [Marinilabiliales bacterium]
MSHAKSTLFSLTTSRLLYILLLIATPFLLLQNYLQSALGQLSDYTYKIGNIDMPITLTVAIAIVLVTLYFTLKKINYFRFISWLIIILLFWIGQKTTDFYFNHKFYELQYNWHYFAYSIFAFINYRWLKAKNRPDYRIILLTFISALEISTLDELIQMPLSNRIFDLGDVSKDLWGTMICLFFIYFVLENGKIIKTKWNVRQKIIKDYFKSPVSLFMFLFVLSYIFMFVSSILTDTDYILQSIIFTLIIFSFIAFAVHISQFKKLGYILISLIFIFFFSLGFSIIKNFNKDITYSHGNILVYKGIPIVYFDVLIYPNGLFRLVDKKTTFNLRDQQTILAKSENIIIVSSGKNGEGAHGFTSRENVHFVFDKNKMKGIQIIPQKNEMAVSTFNRLKTEGKRPLLIYHNN